ncbi:Pectinesterase inhibitor [Spatholobus suberectus]|nr:Pectinesterase inhibitor [Spatholobus suberectus]
MTHNFSSLVLVFLLFVASSYAIKGVELDAICKKTKNPTFCLNLLNSKPGGVAGANFVDLAQYVLDVTRANITTTTKLIKRLIRRNPNDLEARDHYTLCLKQFHKGALNKVQSTQEILKSRDYQDLNVAASGIRTHINLCIDGESPSDTPYHDTSLLPTYADAISQVIEIIIIISNVLYK